MLQLLTLTRLSRRLDLSPAALRRRLEAARVAPDAESTSGTPLFSLDRFDEIQHIVKGAR
jgi:hypothetical protein